MNGEMRKDRYMLSCRFAVALAALIVFVCPALAAEGDNPAGFDAGKAPVITVTPPKLADINVAPGQTIRGTLQVFTENREVKVETSVGETTQNLDGSYILLPQSDDPRDLSNWIAVTPKSLVAGPGQVEPLTWTLAVPKDAAPGDYVGLIYVKGLPDEKADGEVRLAFQNAIRMEITVLGDQNFNPVIEKLAVDQFSDGKDFDADIRLENRGNTRVDLNNANARLEITVDGKVVKRFRLEGVVWPDQARVWNVPWDDAPSFGRATTKVIMEFPENGKRKKTTVKREASTFFMPFRELILAVIAGGVLLMLVGAVYTVRRSRRSGAPAAGPMLSAAPMAASPPAGIDSAASGGAPGSSAPGSSSTPGDQP